MDQVDAVSDNLLYFMFLQLFSLGSKSKLELVQAYGWFSILAIFILCLRRLSNSFNSLNQVFKFIDSFWSPGNETDKVHLVEGTSIIWVNILLHLFDIRFSWVCVQCAYHVSKFMSIYVSIRILIKKSEDFSDFSDLNFIQLFEPLIFGHFKYN